MSHMTSASRSLGLSLPSTRRTAAMSSAAMTDRSGVITGSRAASCVSRSSQRLARRTARQRLCWATTRTVIPRSQARGSRTSSTSRIRR